MHVHPIEWHVASNGSSSVYNMMWLYKVGEDNYNCYVCFKFDHCDGVMIRLQREADVLQREADELQREADEVQPEADELQAGGLWSKCENRASPQIVQQTSRYAYVHGP